MSKLYYSLISRCVVSLVFMLAISISSSYSSDERGIYESSFSTIDPKVLEHPLPSGSVYSFANLDISKTDEFTLYTNTLHGHSRESDISDSMTLSDIKSTITPLTFLWEFYHNPHKALSNLKNYMWASPIVSPADEKQEIFKEEDLEKSMLGFTLLTEIHAAQDITDPD